MRLLFRLNLLQKMGHFTSSRTVPLWGKLVCAYVFFFLLFSAYFLLPSFTSLDDQFFNIKFAELIRERGMTAFSHFDWFSGVGPYAWHANMLFYVFLIPFTFVEPLELGIKFYAIASFSFTFCVVYAFFSVLRMRFAFVSTLALLAIFFMPLVIWHLLMARAFVILPALLLLELILLIRRRYLWITILAFLYFFWHIGTFFFPLVVAVVYVIALIFEGKPWNRRMILAPLVGTSAAMMLGGFLLPGFASGFLESFLTILRTVSETGFFGQAVVQEGGEVYPLNVFDLYGLAPVLMGLFIFFLVRDTKGYLIRLRRKEETGFQYDAVWGALLILSAVFLLGTLITKRMLDFFVVFASVLLLYRLRYVLDLWRKEWAVNIAVGVVIFFGLLTNLLLVGDQISQTRRYTLIRGAAEWFTRNSQPGEIVFNPTINYFPTFFFFNQYHNRLIIGIEPRLLYEADPEKYWLWYHVSNEGKICDRQTCDSDILSGKDMQEKGLAVARMMQTEFSTKFVIISPEFPSLTGIMDASTAFQKVYADPIDGYYRVYSIRPE